MKRKILVAAFLLTTGCSPRPSFTKFPKEVVDVKVTGLSELEGKSAADIHALRDQAIQAEPRLKSLLPANYRASTGGMLSGIESGLPWLGVTGWSKANHQNFWEHYADGDSLASLTISNPFLLASLRSTHLTMSSNDTFDPHLDPHTLNELVPVELKVDGPAHKVICRYDWQGKPPSLAAMLYESNPQAQFLLNVANASDLGLGSYKVVKAQCEGVTVSASDKVMSSRQTYRSSAIKDKTSVQVNELVVPNDTFVSVKAEKLPFKLVIYLYHGRPRTGLSEPSVIEELMVTGPDLKR